jgi:hypothetical protein
MSTAFPAYDVPAHAVFPLPGVQQCRDRSWINSTARFTPSSRRMLSSITRALSFRAEEPRTVLMAQASFAAVFYALLDIF